MFAPTDISLFDRVNLTVFRNTFQVLHLWAQTIECYTCDFLQILVIENDTGSVILPSDTTWNVILRDQENNTICPSTEMTFNGYSNYIWNVSESSCSDIKPEGVLKNELIPIYYTLVSLTVATTIWSYGKFVYKNQSFFRRESAIVRSEIQSDLESLSEIRELVEPNVSTMTCKSHRIKSLDVLRGITITLMIFVNYGGGEYWFFKHSSWNGITIADFIFPWFAWIMGVSVALKTKSQLRNSLPQSKIFYEVCQRTIILIILGIIMTNLRNNDYQTMRFPGVLQRLGISYFIAATVELLFMKPQAVFQNVRYACIEDLLEGYCQWLIIGCLTFFHLVITFFVHANACPPGYLGPGGLHNHSLNYNCTGGAAGFIDRWVFTEAHIYQRPTCQEPYKCPLPYDPEGLLGILTTTLCVYFGIHAGRIILVYKKTSQRIKRWLYWSLVTGILAGFFCNFTKETGWIPINKNLWSLSYVLLSSSTAFLLLSFLLFTIDDKKWYSGSPFYEAGMNAILLYVGHIVTKQSFPWQMRITNQSSHLLYLLMDLWGSALWVVIAILLHKRKIFITI